MSPGRRISITITDSFAVKRSNRFASRVFKASNPPPPNSLGWPSEKLTRSGSAMANIRDGSARLKPSRNSLLAALIRTRYAILRKVFAGEGVTCGCAAEGLSISAATTSHHIRQLSLSGLIEVTKHGRYRIVGPRRRGWKAYLALLQRALRTARGTECALSGHPLAYIEYLFILRLTCTCQTP